MIKINFNFLLLLAFYYPFASYAFFCPNNFNQIDFGYTTAQVISACGEPTAKATKENVPQGPQEWSYYVPQTANSYSTQPQPGTIKMTVAFDSNGKAINITVNSLGVGSTPICGGTIQLGNDRDTVQSICGKPAFIKKENNNPDTASGGQPVSKIVTFTYSTQPPVTLIFTDDRLTDKE